MYQAMQQLNKFIKIEIMQNISPAMMELNWKAITEGNLENKQICGNLSYILLNNLPLSSRLKKKSQDKLENISNLMKIQHTKICGIQLKQNLEKNLWL